MFRGVFCGAAAATEDRLRARVCGFVAFILVRSAVGAF